MGNRSAKKSGASADHKGNPNAKDQVSQNLTDTTQNLMPNGTAGG